MHVCLVKMQIGEQFLPKYIFLKQKDLSGDQWINTI